MDTQEKVQDIWFKPSYQWNLTFYMSNFHCEPQRSKKDGDVFLQGNVETLPVQTTLLNIQHRLKSASDFSWSWSSPTQAVRSPFSSTDSVSTRCKLQINSKNSVNPLSQEDSKLLQGESGVQSYLTKEWPVVSARMQPSYQGLHLLWAPGVFHLFSVLWSGLPGKLGKGGGP